MLELFLVILGAVFVGYILATITLCALMLNKFVMGFITKYVFKMTADLYGKIDDETMFNEKMEA